MALLCTVCGKMFGKVLDFDVAFGPPKYGVCTNCSQKAVSEAAPAKDPYADAPGRSIECTPMGVIEAKKKAHLDKIESIFTLMWAVYVSSPDDPSRINCWKKSECWDTAEEAADFIKKKREEWLKS